MTAAERKGAQHKIDAYLGRLRGRLRGLNGDDVREIVEELRSHIADKAGAGDELTDATADETLAALGSPEELANQYLTDEMLARAEVSHSPLRILESLFRWASFSVGGFFVLLASILGYLLGGVFMWCGVLKIIHPQTAGLWLIPDGLGDVEISLRLGFIGPPANGRELLGWWILPIGLAVGCGLVLLTTRFSLWCAGLYRKSHALYRG
jgi:hypothetical protein